MSAPAGGPGAAVRRRAGSGPILIGLVGAFLVLFWLQRQRSTFLRIERDGALARAVAQQNGLSLADAFALRDLVGPDASNERWSAAAAVFAKHRGRLGDGLAAVAAAGGTAAADAALAIGGDDPIRAWERFRLEPEALPGQRFLALRERFLHRSAARD